MSYDLNEEVLCEEKFTELIELAKLHNDEVGAFGDHKFDIDTSLYLTLQDAGMLKVFVARDNETLATVAYITYIVMPHPHFKDVLLAKEDGLFVHPDHRGAMIGYKLIRFADKVLADKYDVHATTQTATERFDHSKMLIKLGYSKLETTYIRRIK